MEKAPSDATAKGTLETQDTGFATSEEAALFPDHQSSIPKAESLEPTTVETNAHMALATVGNMIQTVTDQQVPWRIKALNKVDMAHNIVSLNAAKQVGYQAKVARLERKLAEAKPGSRSYKRKKTALNFTKHRLNTLEARQAKLFDKTYNRLYDGGYANTEEAQKLLEAQAKRESIILKGRLITEKRRREMFEKTERVSKNVARKERLKAEMKLWPTMGDFEQKLKQEMNDKIQKRIAEGGYRK